MYRRPTSIAAALVSAAAKTINDGGVDLKKGTGNWVARRVAANATERGEFGTTVDHDRWPKREPKPIKASLTHEEDFSDVPY